MMGVDILDDFGKDTVFLLAGTVLATVVNELATWILDVGQPLQDHQKAEQLLAAFEMRQGHQRFPDRRNRFGREFDAGLGLVQQMADHRHLGEIQEFDANAFPGEVNDDGFRHLAAIMAVAMVGRPGMRNLRSDEQ